MMKIDQNRSDSSEQTYEIPVTSVLLFLFFLWFFYCRYGNLLFMAQNYDLFLWDSAFISNYCRTIAGPLRCFSSFILQFFYYPLFGAVFLSAVLVLLQRMIKSVFRLNGFGELFSWLPCCLLALLTTRMKYYFFDWVDTAFLFSIAYGLFVALLVVVIYFKINAQRKRALFLFLFSLLTWPLFGFFTLEAVLICLLLELGNHEKKNLFFTIIFPLIAMLISPFLWFPLNSLDIPFSRIWLAGLLEESAVDKDLETFRSFYFVLIATVFLPLLLAAFRTVFTKSQFLRSDDDYKTKAKTGDARSITKPNKNVIGPRARKDSNANVKEKKNSRIKNKFRANSKQIPNNKLNTEKSELNTIKEISDNSSMIKSVNFRCLIILFLFCAMTTMFSYYSPNYKALLKLGSALEKEDWNRVLKISESVADPSDPLLMFRLLALDKKELLADQIFEKALIINEIPDLMKMLANGFYGDRLLYHFGQVNHAARAAMNNWTIRRQRSVWDLETLALCAVTCKESDLANRYLTLLEKTLFHRSKARLLREFLQSENETDQKEKSKDLLSADNLFNSESESLKILARSIRTIRAEIPPRDSFGPFVHPDSILFYEMLTQDFSASPDKLQHRQLAFLLLLKRIDLFLEKCALYLKKSENAEFPRIPGAIQEGLLYYLKYRANTDDTNSKTTSTDNVISKNSAALKVNISTNSNNSINNESSPIKTIRKEDFSFDPKIEKQFEKFCKLVDLLEGKATADVTSTAKDQVSLIDEITTSFSNTFWFYERFLPSVEPYWKKQIETQKKAGTVNAPGEAH